MTKQNALIAGAGNGISQSLAQLLNDNDYQITLAARDTEKLSAFSSSINATTHCCDVTRAADVEQVFNEIAKPLRVVVCNPSVMVRSPLIDLDPQEVANAIAVTAFGSFLVAQQAARIMLEQEPLQGCRGTILFTGASAGVKGFARSAPFTMGKFAQRGLAQSMARELHPQGIHVCWINIDGVVANESRNRVQSDNNPDALLEAAAIAETYLSIIKQHPSAWTNEIAVRPWVETF